MEIGEAKKRFCLVYDWKVMYSINILISIALVVAVTYIYLDNLPYQNPERVVLREILTPVVRVGEDLKIRVVVDRAVDCPTYVHRWIVTSDGTVIGNVISPSPFTGRIGKGLPANQEVQIPDNMKVGHYRLHSDTIIDCGKKGSFVSPFHDLDFEVIE